MAQPNKILPITVKPDLFSATLGGGALLEVPTCSEEKLFGGGEWLAVFTATVNADRLFDYKYYPLCNNYLFSTLCFLRHRSASRAFVPNAFRNLSAVRQHFLREKYAG